MLRITFLRAFFHVPLQVMFGMHNEVTGNKLIRNKKKWGRELMRFTCFLIDLLRMLIE